MAVYRVTDRKGASLTVHSKEQADYWVGLGYSLEDDAKPAQKPAAKSTTKRSTTKKSD